MNDLKFAIESNNKKRVQEIVEHNRKKLSIHQFSTQQLSELEQDELGAALMPFDIPIVEHEAFPVKTLGNGNCLFNSVSFLLSGSYALANILRMMTAAEIYINADKYSNHPKFLMAADCPEITYDSSNLFSIVLRDEASVISDPVKAIEKEAWMTCTDRQWSGMVDVMGLASVIGNNIWSVYPDCNNNIRPIISGVVKPLITSNNQNTIFIMWSRDGNLDNTHGRPFEPNHFIPIVYKPANPYELHQQRDDQLLPPTKKMKVNSEYDGGKICFYTVLLKRFKFCALLI